MSGRCRRLARRSGRSAEPAAQGVGRRHLAAAAAAAVAAAAAMPSQGRAADLAPLPPPGERWAVVTGASSGVGAALARACAAQGFGVILSGRQEGPLQKLAEEIRTGAGRAEVVPVDLSRPEGAAKLHAAVGALSIVPALLVSCAGFAWTGRAAQQPLNNLQDMLAVNVEANAQLCRLFAEGMVQAGRGRLLLVGSLAGLSPGVPGVAAYAASKAFIRSLSLGLRAELQPAGIGVTCLMPGATDTAFAAASGMDRALCFRLPYAREMGVILQADEVARTGLEATLRGDAECIPGFFNAMYATLPEFVRQPVGALMMNEAPAFLQEKRLAAALPAVALPQAASAVDSLDMVPTLAAALGAAVPLLLCLIGLNIAENGSQGSKASPLKDASLDKVMAMRSKQEFVSMWRSGKVPDPELLEGRELRAELLPLGPLWASSWFITNFLFAPARQWLGKGFTGGSGYNVFEGPWRGRSFTTSLSSSLLDGEPALVLDYGADGGDFVWGTVAGMRDELREVAPGLFLGLGSMKVTGGAWNCAPFVMWGDLET